MIVTVRVPDDPTLDRVTETVIRDKIGTALGDLYYAVERQREIDGGEC